MAGKKKYPGQLVFGLDIGTRSIVGTVGYKSGEQFIVVAQKIIEHETRAMKDGQIHDIAQVGATINAVKELLEKEIKRELTDVCIAAAGRVLKTVTTHAEYDLQEERTITSEDVYTLNSIGVEKAYEEFLNSNEVDSETKFYCVGNSVIRYYLNKFAISRLENHKAQFLGVDLIATFLPDEVVDGLYKAVEIAGLRVASLTLEPIAAIQAAIPERFRLLNIALVDVGAGTSDISITRDGCIIGYGMIAIAGDSLTEKIANHCLVDFSVAESIKKDITETGKAQYVDIMGLEKTISKTEIDQIIKPTIEEMTKQVSDKIKELNGGKAVSAVFVVGGGGKINGYTEGLSAALGIQEERVALRGEEVMQKIEFLDKKIKKDSILVTPIGICLNFYEQNNNFIYVSFNNSKVKLYDNGRLTVVDAAVQADFPNDGFFPKRGKELNITVNKKKRIIRGEQGDSAVITVNGQPGNMHSQIHENDIVTVIESTAGSAAQLEIGMLPEYQATLSLWINEKMIELPKFASVNGELQSEYYTLKDKDKVEFLPYYTIKQILDFMDVVLDKEMTIYVNNKSAEMDTKVYENFSVLWTMEQTVLFDRKEENESEESEGETSPQDIDKKPVPEDRMQPQSDVPKSAEPIEIVVLVNKKPVVLKGKVQYIFVDVFDFIEFDLSKPQGSSIETTLNGSPAQYMESIKDGDCIEIYWRNLEA